MGLKRLKIVSLGKEGDGQRVPGDRCHGDKLIRPQRGFGIQRIAYQGVTVDFI